MNDLERTLRRLLEGHEDDESQPADTEVPNPLAPPTIALNDDTALARALGAQTLNGNQI